jgi:hypothetical protein
VPPDLAVRRAVPESGNAADKLPFSKGEAAEPSADPLTITRQIRVALGKYLLIDYQRLGTLIRLQNSRQLFAGRVLLEEEHATQLVLQFGVCFVAHEHSHYPVFA